MKTLWLISTSRNIIIVIFCSALAYFLYPENDDQESPFVLTGKIRLLWVTVKLWMIKNMLKRRKESDTYLATFRRHHWSAQMTMKRDEKR